jgi:Mrp family chromosome partitioning ATPase
LVVDADLRSPSLAGRAGLEGTLGLTDVLDGTATVTSAAQPFGEGVDVLAAGSGHSNPHFALGSTAMSNVVRDAVDEYDFVIVQAASVLDFADALTLAHLTDGTLVIARSRSTNRRQLLRGLESLEGAKAPVVGIVLTQARLDATSRRSPAGRRPSKTRHTKPAPADTGTGSKASDNVGVG